MRINKWKRVGSLDQLEQDLSYLRMKFKFDMTYAAITKFQDFTLPAVIKNLATRDISANVTVCVWKKMRK